MIQDKIYSIICDLKEVAKSENQIIAKITGYTVSYLIQARFMMTIYQIRLQTKLKSQSIGSDFGFNVMRLPMPANENSLVSPYDMLLMVNHMNGILNLLKPGVTAMTGKILYYVEKKEHNTPLQFQTNSKEQNVGDLHERRD